MYSVLGMNETGAALRLLFELKQRKNDKMSICSMLDKLLTSLSPLSPFSVSCSETWDSFIIFLFIIRPRRVS